MTDETPHDAVLERTREASQATAAIEAELERRRGEPLRPGDLILHPATAEQGVEWLVLERGEDGRWLLLPADTHPLAGSADVEIPAGQPAGPLTLRCKFAVRVEPTALAVAERSGELAPEALRQARDKHRWLAAGILEGDPLEREVDSDPEYQQWLEEGVAAAREGMLELTGRRPRSEIRQPRLRQTATRLPWALAASLAAAVLGLFSWGLRLNEKSHSLIIANHELQAQLDHWAVTPERPLLVGSFGEVALGERTRGGLRTLRVPAQGLLLVTVTLGGKIPDRESYRLEVFNPASGQQWRSPAFGGGLAAEITVVLPASLLTGDRLELRLFAETRGSVELLAEETAALEHEEHP